MAGAVRFTSRSELHLCAAVLTIISQKPWTQSDFRQDTATFCSVFWVWSACSTEPSHIDPEHRARKGRDSTYKPSTVSVLASHRGRVSVRTSDLQVQSTPLQNHSEVVKQLLSQHRYKRAASCLQLLTEPRPPWPPLALLHGDGANL